MTWILFWTTELSCLLAWIATSYVLFSLLEYISHRVFMHSENFLSRRFSYFQESLHEHRNFHHAQCFPGRRFLKSTVSECFLRNFQLRPLMSVLFFSFVWIPIFFWSPMGAGVFIATVVMHNVVFSIMHRQMHTPVAERKRWFSNSRVCMWLARHHYLHHVYPSKNNNGLFPLWDWPLGTYAVASEKDNQNMQELGLFIEKPGSAD